jgi:hypothetical protein
MLKASPSISDKRDKKTEGKQPMAGVFKNVGHQPSVRTIPPISIDALMLKCIDANHT